MSMKGNTLSRSSLLGLLLLVTATPLPAQEPTAADELARHLANIKLQVEDISLPIGQREALALGMAGTLDRAAQAAPGAEPRQAQWNQAIEILDTFNSQNPGHPRTREFQLQAGVYRWASGRSWSEVCDLNPADVRARSRPSPASTTRSPGSAPSRRERPGTSSAIICDSGWPAHLRIGPNWSLPIRPPGVPGNRRPWICSRIP